jgi:peptidoglycan/LPS O-acetylase OafA/YrhL
MWSTVSRYMTSTQASNYRSDIDGLRAVAVLAVVGFHCGLPFLKGGFVGVDVFFVISGYLICSILYKEMQQGSFSIARFYERRFKRILPALSLVLLFCLGLGVLVLSPFEARRLGDSAVATSLSASNLLFNIRTGYFAVNAAANPLLMTWSLAVEEQFYIVFPLLMLLLARKSMRRRTIFLSLAALSSLSLAASIYCEFRQPTWNFYLPVTRAWELGAGTMLAVWQRGKLDLASRPAWMTDWMGAIGIAMVLGSIFFYRAAMRFPGYEAIPPVLGSVLILASAGGRANRLLGLRPLVAVGLISYSLYLWHWPLLSFAGILNGKPMRPQTLALVMTAAFAAATLSYFLVEKPFRAWRGAKTSTVLYSYGSWLIVLTGIAGLFSITHGWPQRSATLYGIESTAMLERKHTCLATGSELKTIAACVGEASSSVPALAVLGDSHAETLVDVLQRVTARNGWHLVALTRVSCPPIQDVSYWTPTSVTNVDSCRSFNTSALQYVLGRADIRTVLLAGHWGGGSLIAKSFHGDPGQQNPQEHAENLKDGLEREIAALEAAGKKVIVMQDVPQFPYDPVAAVRYEYLPLRRDLNRAILAENPDSGDHNTEKKSLLATAEDSLSYDAIAELQASDAKISVVDPTKVLCKADRCSFEGQSGLYYSDAGHLSERGAMQIAPLISNLITVN